MAFSPNAETVFADGPFGSPLQPSKSEIRALLTQYESVMDAFWANGGLIYTSKSSLDSDLDHDAKTSAWVVGDATVANNGVYQKQGASGGGSWTRVADLPFSFIIASDAGAGTANAIQATTSIPVSSSALVWLNIFEANTASPVTVSFNGGSALTVKTNAGNNVAVGALAAGTIVMGLVSGSTFRLISDQTSTAIQAAAEAAQVAAEAARDEAEAAAAAAALRDPEAFAMAGNGTTGPYNVGETIAADSAIVVFVSGVAQVVGTDFTYAGSNITFTSLVPTASDVVHGFVFASRAVGVPTSASVGVDSINTELKGHIPSLSPNAALVDESATQLKLNYHKARAGWHVKAFGTTLTDVGGGNASVDTAALQAAVDSREIIDLTGAVLELEDTINVSYPGACLSSAKSGRVGNTATSRISIVDDALPYAFDCSATNLEASGFALDGTTTNTTTIGFHFKRPDGSARDIDSVLKGVVFERMAKAFHIYGRGLELGDCTIAEMKTCMGDIDWPTVSTPNGSSNDTDETGMRAYHFYNTRAHGNSGGFRNIGWNSKNMRGLIIDGFMGDIGIGGGGAFVGVAVDSFFANIESQINATIASGLVDLYAGSKNVKLVNVGGGGIKTASVTRLGRYSVILRPAFAADGSGDITEITILNGTIGPNNRHGVWIDGSGRVQNLVLNTVNFDRCNIEGTAYAPIYISENGGSLSEVTIKLVACNFKYGAETAPTNIVGGLNSSIVTIYKDAATTKQSGPGWAQSNVVLA
ncbi:hypothetical protein [Sinorhizobium meliloti]|uniref:hypothetical protein n=1 Tax=Rhizobium meliloti TaxID=382 RepID=UPI001912446D|nr:hypothetical protein [Sinorhizobium meliloti]